MNKYLGILFVAVAFLQGCAITGPGSSMYERALGKTVVVPDRPLTVDELLKIETDETMPLPGSYEYERDKEVFTTHDQTVFGASRKPYVLGFAQQEVANRANWKQVAETTLDLANVGMHVFSAGVSLAPLWVTLLDYDKFALAKSHDRKEMRMPSMMVYAPYPQYSHLPLDEAMVKATTDLGERLVATGLCRYHQGPRRGSFGGLRRGMAHGRKLMCGRPSPDSKTVQDFGNALVYTMPMRKENPLSKLFGEGTVVAHFYWLPEWTNYNAELSQKVHDYAWMGPQFTAALDGYKVLKPAIPDNAYTVLTGPDQEGQWKVFVARDDTMVTYDPFWTREFKRAELQAQQARKDLNL